MRNATGFGPRRLGKELKQQKGIQLSERTIWKIIRSGSSTNLASDNLETYSAMGAINQVSVGV
jgi:hypothetical protein